VEALLAGFSLYTCDYTIQCRHDDTTKCTQKLAENCQFSKNIMKRTRPKLKTDGSDNQYKESSDNVMESESRKN